MIQLAFDFLFLAHFLPSLNVSTGGIDFHLKQFSSKKITLKIEQ